MPLPGSFLAARSEKTSFHTEKCFPGVSGIFRYIHQGVLCYWNPFFLTGDGEDLRLHHVPLLSLLLLNGWMQGKALKSSVHIYIMVRCTIE